MHRIAKIMLPKDYMAYKPDRQYIVRMYSDASGMLLLDVKNRKWSEEMLAICGISRGAVAKIFMRAMRS